MAGRDDGSAIEALRLTYVEYRAVLDHQLALVNELDDRVMWPSRTAVVLLGILISAFGLAGRSILVDLPIGTTVFFALGGLGLVLTIFVGIGAYTVSNPNFGVDASHRRELQERPYTEREWLNLMLDEFEQWSHEMEAINAKNAQHVFQTQTLLIGSLAVLLVGTTLLAL